MTTKKKAAKKKRGRKLVTGRFATREELERKIVFLADIAQLSWPDIAKNCEVATTTVEPAYKRFKANHAVKDVTVDPEEETLTEASLGEVITKIETERITDPAFVKYEVAKRIAHTLSQSGLVPDAYRGRPNDCFVAINMGAELGLEPFQAIQSIAVIDGKPCLYGDGLIGVVRASPKCLWIEETISDDGKTATCRTQRKGDPNPIEATYSWSDAMQAGIESKFNWKKHPKRMLQMRARAYCLRDAYPDLLKGLGVVEEMDAHEDTPPPVVEFDLPAQVESTTFDDTVTLAVVERAMHQSETMEALLKAGDMAKGLGKVDQGTARITYKKMRAALLEDAEAAKDKS